MTTFEEAYLTLVLAAFLVFGTTLFAVDRLNRAKPIAKIRRRQG